MRILNEKTLKGPNNWSIRKPMLVEMLLDLEDLEDQPTNKIPGFYERLTSLLPSLYSHECSEGKPGGFFTRIREGTWMGHVMEHIAIELQSLADMKVGFGRTRGTGIRGQYYVVFAYLDAEAGLFAGHAAFEICRALVDGLHVDLGSILNTLQQIWNRNRYGPSTMALVKEAESRGIPVTRISHGSLVQLGYGKNQQRIAATIAGNTSGIAMDIASDKESTKAMLEEAGIAVPVGRVIDKAEDLEEAAAMVGYPLVIKPVDGNHGNGATTNIRDRKTLLEAFEFARRYSPRVIVEKFIEGNDYRVLLVNYKFIAAALRTPASITGDGIQTIQQLVQRTNSDSRRGDGHSNILTRIHIDTDTLNLLARQGLDKGSVLERGRVLRLKSTANLSTGGTATDVTEEVHPMNRALFERAARIIGLNVCGLDIMASTLAQPLNDVQGAILEVNAAPGFRMHLQPSAGKARNVAAPVIDMLFPDQAQGRIPIIAVTGTNGKTTTTRLIAKIASEAGYFTGYTTTDGIYIGEEMITKGDCSGPGSARQVLNDPAVEFAVLETARGGMLRSGLAFDGCDVAVVTNVAADHLGIDGIHDLEQLAHVKAILPESVVATGTAVLNAEDELVFGMKKKLSCRIALFALNNRNEQILAHVREGGLAAVLEEDYITIMNRGEKYRIEHVQHIPLTFGGKAGFNIANVLAATAACYARGISVDAIRRTLRRFEASPSNTPGRLNIFEVGNSHVLIDYAHNPHGLKALGEFILNLDHHRRIGIVTGVGDRRDEDILAIGEESARIFDEIIIRHDEDLRGRTAEEMHRLILSGIQRVQPDKPVRMISHSLQEIEEAVENLDENCLLVILVEDVFKSLRMMQEKEMMRAEMRV